MVGEAEEQAIVLLTQQRRGSGEELAAKRGIGIIGSALVDDVCHEIVGKRRMDAIAPAMTETMQPAQGAAHHIFSIYKGQAH